MQILDYTGFRGELKKGVLGGYLFCGEEAYLMRHSVNALKKAVFGGADDDTFNHMKIDASGADYDLADAISQIPVFAEKRLVELWGCDLAHMKADEISALTDALSLLADNPQTVFVMCVTPYELDVSGLPKKPPKVFTKLAELITPVVFSRETPASLAKWCAAHFAHENVSADRRVIQYLVERVGGDMYTLSGEIAKLCAAAGARGDMTVTEADVTEICALRPEIGAFDFSNAVIDGNFDRAIFILSDAKKKRAEPVIFLSDILRAYSRMELILALDGDGMTAAEISKKIKMHEYPVRNHLKAAKRLGRKKLEKAIGLCSQADFKMKLTQINGYVVVSRLLAELAML